MTYILFFIGTFLCVYIFYNLFVIQKEKALKKMRNGKEIKLLIRLSGLDVDKCSLKKVVNSLALTNAFIISLIGTIILLIGEYIDNFYIWIIVSVIVGLILLIPLITGLYKLIGKKMKERQNV